MKIIIILIFFTLSFINLKSFEITPLIYNYRGAEIFGDSLFVLSNEGYIKYSFDGGDNWKTKKIFNKQRVKFIFKNNNNYFLISEIGMIKSYDLNLDKSNFEYDLKLTDESLIHSTIFKDEILYLRTFESVYKFEVDNKKVNKVDVSMPKLRIADKLFSSTIAIFKDNIYLPYDDSEFKDNRLIKMNLDLEIIDTLKFKEFDKNVEYNTIYINADDNYLYFNFVRHFIQRTNDFVMFDTMFCNCSDYNIKLFEDSFYYADALDQEKTYLKRIVYKGNKKSNETEIMSIFDIKDGYLRSYMDLSNFAISDKYIIQSGKNGIYLSYLDSNRKVFKSSTITEFGSIYFGDYSLPHQLSDGRIMALSGYDSFYQKALYYSDNNGETFHPLLDTSNQKFKNFTNRRSTAHLFYHDNIDDRYYFLHELVKIGTNLATLYSTNYDFNSMDEVDFKDNLSATSNPMEKLEVKKFNNTTYYKYNRSNQYGSGVTIYDFNLNHIINRKLGKPNSKLLFSSMLNENLDFIFFRETYFDGKFELVFTDSSAINLKVIKTIDYEKYYNNNSITVNGMDYLGLCYFDSLKNKVIYEIMNCQTQEFITLKEADYNEDEIENYKKTALYYFEGKLYFAFLNSLFTIDFDKLNTNIWSELKFRDNGRIVKNMRMLNNTLFAYYSDDFNSEAIYKLENIDFTSSIETTEDFEIPTISILNLFPNPSENTVEISLNFDQRYDINNTEVTLFDINGIKSNNIDYNIIKLSVYNSKIIIDITNIVKGTYIINLNLGNQNITRKFVKN